MVVSAIVGIVHITSNPSANVPSSPPSTLTYNGGRVNRPPWSTYQTSFPDRLMGRVGPE